MKKLKNFINDECVCKDVGELLAVLKMFTADCPITPIKVKYKMDNKGYGRLDVSVEEDK